MTRLGIGAPGSRPKPLRATARSRANVNSSGERIYHLPFQQFYDRTKIDEGGGERWFCSEGEAQSGRVAPGVEVTGIVGRDVRRLSGRPANDNPTGPGIQWEGLWFGALIAATFVGLAAVVLFG